MSEQELNPPGCVLYADPLRDSEPEPLQLGSLVIVQELMHDLGHRRAARESERIDLEVGEAWRSSRRLPEQVHHRTTRSGRARRPEDKQGGEPARILCASP